MTPIPLTLQTLYADLVQQVHAAPAEAGSVYAQTVKGIDYLYVRTTVGATRRDRFLGRADDPKVQARAAAARSEAKRVAERRNTVRILRGQGVPAPTTELGRVYSMHWPMPASSRPRCWSERQRIKVIRRSWAWYSRRRR